MLDYFLDLSLLLTFGCSDLNLTRLFYTVLTDWLITCDDFNIPF